MSLIAELKRRNVFRVGVAYAIVSWLLLEVASVRPAALQTCGWVAQHSSYSSCCGFPLTLVIVAWAFELTRRGSSAKQMLIR